jgi:hypothetical protein
VADATRLLTRLSHYKCETKRRHFHVQPHF